MNIFQGLSSVFKEHFQGQTWTYKEYFSRINVNF